MLTKETLEKLKDDISYNNILLGLETVFLEDTDSSFVARTEGNKIFINLAQVDTPEQLATANKHEVLHHFEESESFVFAKEEILNTLTQEEKERIYKEYYLRYAGIYSPAQIADGILDTEIAIDFIVGNIYEHRKEKYSPITDNLYEIIVTYSSANKQIAERLLNLSLTNRIEQSFAQATIWEKIFIMNFYDGKNHILPTQKETKYSKVREDIITELQRLYDFAEDPKNFEIYTQDNKELEREFESEIKAMQARGEGELAKITLNNKATMIKEMAKRFSEQLHAEYKHIVDFIKTTEYEPAFKCLMLRETLLKTYKKDNDNQEEKTIVKPRDLHKSISGHITLNEVVLKTIYNNLKDHSNFANLYFAGLELFNKSTSQKNEITLDGVETFGMGKWLKFEGKQSNAKEYLKNAQNLASLVQYTPWCTKTLASSQLAQGDFFVFVDNSNHPHIAVKMSGKEIDEVRGLKGGNAQELEDEYRPVAIEFLTKNKNIQNGKEWLEKEEWNARLISYSKKIDEQTLQKDEIPQLLKDLSQNDYKSHGTENSNKTTLYNKIENSKFAKSVIAEHFNCKPEEITLEKTVTSPNYVVIIKNADFRDLQITNLGNLKYIGGSADFTYSKITSLGNLEYIGKWADFSNSKVTNLGKLKYIGKSANFKGSKITSLGDLEYIGGFVYFTNSQITSLGKLKHIGGDAYFTNSQITDLGNLEYIGRDANFYDSQIADLGNLEYIGGDAYFRDSQITSLGKLKHIGYDADFRGSQITNLGDLEYIGGNAYFDDSNVKSLGNLEYIGGDADFYDSQITDLGNLEYIGGNVNFNYSQVSSLGNLKHIGGNADFGNSKITTLGKLKHIKYNTCFTNSQITDLGDLEYIGKLADFSNSKVTNLGKLKHIGESANFKDSKITSLGNLEYIGKWADFSNSKVTNLGKLKYIGKSANFKGSKITSLGDLEYIGGIADFRGSKITSLGKLKEVEGELLLDDEQKILFADRIEERCGKFYLKPDLSSTNEKEKH